MAADSEMDFTGRMTRHIVASALWAYFGWYFAAHLMAVLGLPAALAPIGGAVVLAVAWYDPRRSEDGTRTARVPGVERSATSVSE